MHVFCEHVFFFSLCGYFFPCGVQHGIGDLTVYIPDHCLSAIFCHFRFSDVFPASRVSLFRIYFIFTAAGVVARGGRRTSPHTTS